MMRCTRVLVFVLLAVLAAPFSAFQEGPAPLPYRDARLPVEDRVRDLLSRMTLEEKFWQAFMIPGDLARVSHDSVRVSHSGGLLSASVA